MTKDKYVQVLNPKTKRFTLINKTKGVIVGIKRDDKPFSNTEIIEIPESKKGLNLKAGEDFVYNVGQANYVRAIKLPEVNFGSAVKKAMKIEKSVADKAYDKFKEDERKHRTKLKKALERIDTLGDLVTAHDAETPMVIMWELLQKGYIEDVTPTARTGGAVTPDTTYCYKTTSKGRIFIMGYGYP